MIWRLRYDDTLDGQLGAGYEASAVQGIVKAFADMIGSDVAEWKTANLAGVESSAQFAGLKVAVWGTVYE